MPVARPSLSILSSIPVTVTICSVLQVVALNVSDAGDATAMPASALATITVTLPVGWVDSRTV